MPVRGRGWYKRPYRISYTDRDGTKRSKAFHWKGPWREEADFLRRAGYKDVKTRVIKNANGRVLDIDTRRFESTP